MFQPKVEISTIKTFASSWIHLISYKTIITEHQYHHRIFAKVYKTTRKILIHWQHCYILCWMETLIPPNQIMTFLPSLAHQAPLSMGFSRQEYWSGLPCPPPGELPNPGIEPKSFMSPSLAGRFFTWWATGEAPKVTLLLLLLRRFSRVRLCATPETAAHQAPPSLGFSRQEHWSGVPFPSPKVTLSNPKWVFLNLCQVYLISK